jgi:biotin transport system ATP-binding protein
MPGRPASVEASGGSGMGAENIIEIENLSHRFTDGTLGLDSISLGIPKGGFIVIVGRNGSGKTTLLRHLNGLLPATAGTVKIAGLPVEKNLKTVRQMVGMVFQDADSQIVGETVRDDVAFGPENLGLAPEQVHTRVSEALDTVGLSRLAHQQPHLLSSGEKRRLAIAGILSMYPEVIVFDEPFSNLDFPGLKQVLHQIVGLHRQRHTLVMATHDVEAIMGYADRLLIMAEGRVVRDGTPQELANDLESYGVRPPGRLHLVEEAVS